MYKTDVPPNELAFSCRERAGRCPQKPNDLAHRRRSDCMRVLCAPWHTDAISAKWRYFFSGSANRTPSPTNTLPVSHFITVAMRGSDDNRSPIAPEKKPYIPYTTP